MAGQAQKETLAEPQFPAQGSSSLSLLEVLATSLPTAIESRLETSMMEPRSKWHISPPPHLHLYAVSTLIRYWRSFSFALLSTQPYLQSVSPSPLLLSEHHQSTSPLSSLSFIREIQLKLGRCPDSHVVYRRNAPQKAWTSGMNPITQRSTTSGQQNGVGPQAKNNTHKAAVNQEANMEKLANERLIYLLANFLVSERDGTGHF